jgi:hypothetical protein
MAGSSLATVVVATVLIAATVGLAALLGPPATAAEASLPECDQTVTHDAFQQQAAISEFNETGNATSESEFTTVSVADADAFVRLAAENPNGYCTRIRVRLDEAIVAPAELGEIQSVDENTTAEWHAVQDLNNDTLHTRVEFVLPAHSNATFAPTKARVLSLAWTATAKRESDGLLQRPDWLGGGESELKQRRYELEPSSTGSVTIPLEQGNRTIDGWQATYTVDGETYPVTDNPERAVHATEADGMVVFEFEDANATATFVAEPKLSESVGHAIMAYTAGFRRGESLWPFSMSLAGLAAAASTRRWSRW